MQAYAFVWKNIVLDDVLPEMSDRTFLLVLWYRNVILYPTYVKIYENEIVLTQKRLRKLNEIWKKLHSYYHRDFEIPNNFFEPSQREIHPIPDDY